MNLARPVFRVLSPAGAGARLSILIFHRVLPEPDPLFPGEVDAERFDAVCSWLREWFDVLPLDVAVRALRDGSLGAGSLTITFDDGYADNYDVALPILQRHGLPATFFVATGFLDGGRMWNDTVIESVRRTGRVSLDFGSVGCTGIGRLSVETVVNKQAAIAAVLKAIKHRPARERQTVVDAIARQAGVALPVDLMMRSEQVRSLHRAGMQIGAHTVSHPILATLDDATALQEMGSSKDFLERLLGERVALFAYPNGRPGSDYGPAAVRLARSLGFDAAVTTAMGAAGTGSDPFQLPRFTPWDRGRARFGVRLAHNLWNAPPRLPA